MHKVVLLRHGESVWNRDNIFAGWVDVALSDRGVTQAKEAGRVLQENGFVFDLAFTSFKFISAGCTDTGFFLGLLPPLLILAIS